EIHGDKTVDAFEEIPGTGIIARVNGCDIRAGSRKLMDGSEMYKEPEGNSGSRYSTVFLSINRIYKGRFNVRNKYRENIHELARTLGENYKISVLSGDSDGERHVLNSIFPHSAEILFRQEPEGKLNYIKKLREQGRNVMMLGDGLNDAGALKISNLGVAVTDDITLFTPASDVIMDGRNLSNLPLMIRFSHAAKKVIIASFIISFLYNIVGLGFAVSGNLSPVIAAILMPASSISVVLFSTIMINFLARIYDL
ncbi:MAG TPA: HAD-IC family P-type ATPase, partial [Cyclobacteriaceae bacterium]|nr:HAD-IC family P-type ATPase [Cyclobacteriaceae bacterium]